jgi:SAM-dependent methyltransferase
MTQLSLACPDCHTLLEDINSSSKRCPKDGRTFQQVKGIWRMLSLERAEYFSGFIQDYETVRRAEGRASTDATYYRTLPYHPTNDWRIRAKSFDVFLKYVIVPAEKRNNPLRILDLGAGNGWLSNRLAARGHAVAAVDLTVNDFDGLGCYRFYESAFLPVQAEFDHLPFEDNSIDILLFNASLHYSVNYEKTLGEALRTLGHGRKLVVVDSPVYHDADSGSGMVREREEQFRKSYGFASDSLHSENYLTYIRLDDLAHQLNLAWEFITPFYGYRWITRPLLAKILHRREPAKFHVIVGERK